MGFRPKQEAESRLVRVSPKTVFDLNDTISFKECSKNGEGVLSVEVQTGLLETTWDELFT